MNVYRQLFSVRSSYYVRGRRTGSHVRTERSLFHSHLPLTKHISRVFGDRAITGVAGEFSQYSVGISQPGQSTALYFYDRVLVLSQEVDLMWRRKNSGYVVLSVYIALHVSTIFYLISGLCAPDNISCEVCIAKQRCVLYALNFNLLQMLRFLEYTQTIALCMMGLCY